MSFSRIVFMGSDQFACSALQALVRAGQPPISVWTQPPRKSGRGQIYTQTPVALEAERFEIPARQPEKLDHAAMAIMEADQPDLVIVVAYGLMIPSAFLAIPHRGCINLHASLLPRWRGAAPIERAIMAGDLETGVTVMAMNERLDSGAVLGRLAVAIEPLETGAMLRQRLAILGARLLSAMLPALLAGSVQPEAQSDQDASYAPKLKRADGIINWNRSAQAIFNQVRALQGRIRVVFKVHGEQITVLEASRCDVSLSAASLPGARPGVVLPAPSGKLHVQCGQGVIALTQLQRPGKRAMAAHDLLNGFAIPAGTELE